MNKKTINGVAYIQVASIHKDYLLLEGMLFKELRLELEMEYLCAQPGYDTIYKGLAWAKFCRERSQLWYDCEEYENVLSTILRSETGKYPKYKEQADLCTSIISTIFLRTDGCYSFQRSEEVNKFYAERFPQCYFDE